MAGHAQLKFVTTECSKTQIRLTGLIENFDFSTTADTLSKAGGKVLGAVISKTESHKDVGFKTYSKLFSSCVIPVLDYCSGVWGFKQFDKIDMIQNLAIRYFMGVHRFTPILAMAGDMGWVTSTQFQGRWVFCPISRLCFLLI